MAIFVIETYLSRARPSALEETVARLRGEIEQRAIVARAGQAGASPRPPARYLRSFYVADDEVAYHLVETGSAEAAAELSQAAGLVPERIVEAEAATG